MAYAEGTVVPPEKSQIEIRQTLVRYGASHFVFGEAPNSAVIGFNANGRTVRFELPLPKPDDEKFRYTSAGRWRAPSRRADALAYQDYLQEIRRRWRALALAIKAKLEVVHSGIASFEEEFLAHIVLPDGRTVGMHVAPAVARAYESGQVRGLLPEFTGERE
jgi:hypothetical protein